MTAELITAEELVVVRVDGHAYGIPVAAVVEVTRMVALSPPADSWPWVAGVANLRGTAVPVVDLADRLGRAARAPILERRIVFAGDPADPVGLIVDEVIGVAPAGPAVPGGPTSPLVRHAVRVGPDLVMVLDETAFRVGGDG
ncbi:MAG TPA: chemotaxis protein CheW [Acidimicrobiia bacterium]|jgi:chemotaxis signal transduction protein|nr:chemotaxis protein CheW [Acidimicrobiia bacterium]